MNHYWDASTRTTQTGVQDEQADRLLSRSQSALSGTAASSHDDAKMVKAGKDFESILLGSWLQQAEQSFATVPGGDGQGDEDTTKDQFQGIAMQALAGSLTASGGVGIARTITESLRSHHQDSRPKASSTHSSAAVASPVAGGLPATH